MPNLADPRTFAAHDMDEIWRGLRERDPVHWHPESDYGPGFWVVSRYADVLDVLRDDTVYTSEKGNVLATMLNGGDSGGGRMLAVSDGEYHTELRKLLLKAFAPRVLEPVVHRVRRTARRLLAEAIERGGCDVARDIASVLPLETICDLLDVPAGDRQYVFKLTKSALSLDYESQSGEDPAARREILIYFSGLVAERRKSLGSDPISLMATGEVGGKRLDDITIILNCYSLVMGGDGTNRLAIIGAVKALMDNPDQWEALKSGAVTPEAACEEVLRWTTPTMHFGRTALADTTLGGKRIAAGDLVTLWFASANRDEAVFPDPGRFDLGRAPNKHVALGYARHFCLGGYLGRAEITAVLDALRVAAVGMRQTAPERYLYSNFLQGMSSLQIELGGDAAALADPDE
ncbi:cytochrome P450 [Spirillospora sp. NPDC000708]